MCTDDDMARPKLLTPSEFFALDLPNASMTDASHDTRLSLNTIRAAKAAPMATRASALKLSTWSRRVPAAVERGVAIGFAKALGVHEGGAQ